MNINNSKYPKTSCPMPGMDTGNMSLEDLELVIEIVRKHDIPMVKISGGNRLYFHGMEEKNLQILRQELGVQEESPQKTGNIHNIQACPGKRWCKYGKMETEKITRLLAELKFNQPLPAKVKVGISGCHFCCCESWVRDIGLSGEKNGWKLTIGGNAGGRPRIGNIIGEGLNDQEAFNIIKKTLLFYIKNAKHKTRTARFMEQITIDDLKKGIEIQD